MKNLRQRGELALTLSLLGIFISLVGIGIGTGMSRSVQQSTSQAEADSFPFKSVLEVQEVLPSGQIQTLQWESGFTWKNTYRDVVTEKIITGTGEIKDSTGLARVVWDPISTGQVVPAGIRGAKVDVELFIPDSYEVKSSFCTPADTSICKKVSYSDNSLTIRGITIEKGGDITYGIKVAKKGGQQPTAMPTSNPTATPTQTPTATQTPNACPISGPECAPRNVKVTEVSERSVYVKWDLPQGCAGFVQGSDYWIDVERSGDSIVCAAEGGTDGNKQCDLGKSQITQGRLLDRESEEFKKRKWDENREYTVKVFTHNVSPSCVSPVASTTFTYEVEAEPTEDPKKEGLSCGRGCIYSEGTKCLVGRCRADNPDCTDGIANANIGCEYAGDANTCGIPASEVDCKTGELKDKKDNRTACEAQNGSCIREANCAPESGTLRKDLVGCTGSSVCCVLPARKPTEDKTPVTITIDTKSSVDFYNSDSYLGAIQIKAIYASNGKEAIKNDIVEQGNLVVFKDLIIDDEISFYIAYLGESINQIAKVNSFAMHYNLQALKDDNYYLSIQDAESASLDKFYARRIPSLKQTELGTGREFITMISGNASSESIKSILSLSFTSEVNRGLNLSGQIAGKTRYSSRDKYIQEFSTISYSRHEMGFKNANNDDYQAGPFVVPASEDFDDYYRILTHFKNLKNNRILIKRCSECSSAAIIENEDGTGILTFITKTPQTIELVLEKRKSQLPSIENPIGGPFAITTNTDSDKEITTASIELCSSSNCLDVPIIDGIYDSSSIVTYIDSHKDATIGCKVVYKDGVISSCDKVLASNMQTMYLILNDKPRFAGESELSDSDDDGVVSGKDLGAIVSSYNTPENDINGDKVVNALDYSVLLRWLGEEVIYLPIAI